ncbi:MAG: hypothetical protein A2161_02210 [Candidatus Schekmanbacteria bacterium RBG_13_48_7]|uniref:Uncharacterized protein n=1 Tax=Candidatus Schekmanbacteria bacterium RBG_13_48_7 TaxID=1817878 RepID=A0A1F7RTU5_9BACT|nr:MAG: hypothetical protein A2161_02210 [Candidatus Schekmanbacteria bacterium RBG_13_48_7]
MDKQNEKISDKEKQKTEIKDKIKTIQQELKNISRQLLKAKDLSEQRYLKQHQKELEMQIMRLNAQLKEI